MKAKELKKQKPGVGFPIHPLAQAMPEMPEREYRPFKKDIRDHGQMEPIKVLNGMVIDGRHRQRACLELGIEPWYVFLKEGTDPLQYILSNNRFRRHDTKSQMAIAAVKVYMISHGLSWSGKQDAKTAGSEFANLQIEALTQDQAARMIGVSKRMFSHAMRLYEPGSNSSESLKLAAEQGLLNVSDASREVDELKEVQDEAVGLVLNDKFKTVLSAVREVHRGRAQPTVPDTLIPESWHGPRGNVALHNCKIEELQALVPPDSVDAIITGVPDEDGAPRTLRGLASFAAHALKPDGVMLVFCRSNRLPYVFRSVQHGTLDFLLELDYRYDMPGGKLHGKHGVQLRRMPLLVWGMPEFVLGDGDDVIQLPEVDGDSANISIGRRHAVGTELIVRRFTHTGDTVCDPLLMSGSSAALAALRSGRRFVGSCHDGGRFEYVRGRLMRETKGI